MRNAVVRRRLPDSVGGAAGLQGKVIASFLRRRVHAGVWMVGLVSAFGCLSACTKSASAPGDKAPEPEVDATTAFTNDGASGGAPGGLSDTGAVTGGGPAGPADSYFEPPDLPHVPLDTGGVLSLVASTLKAGPAGLELYAAVRNGGEAPLCSAAVQVEFYGQQDELIETVSAGVQSGQLYRLPDSSTTISCVAPKQTAMVAMTNIPERVVLEDLKSLGHRFPAFQIDGATALDWVSVSELEAVEVAGGTVFQGKVTNSSEVTVREPLVSVFPVNAVGRPLGVATASADVEIPPGESWAFETDVIAERGTDQAAVALASQ